MKPILLAAAPLFAASSATAQDSRHLLDHYITVTCMQNEVAFPDDEALNAFFDREYPQRYRVDVTQTDDRTIVFEEEGQIYGRLNSWAMEDHQFWVDVYDTRISETEPEFSLEATATSSPFGGLIWYRGSTSEGSVDGDLWIRYGKQGAHISINDIGRFFTCTDGIQMIERE